MRAMERKSRECEAASVLLSNLHPKLIDPEQVRRSALCPDASVVLRCSVDALTADVASPSAARRWGRSHHLRVGPDLPSARFHCPCVESIRMRARGSCCGHGGVQASLGFTRLLTAADDASLDTPTAAHLLVRALLSAGVMPHRRSDAFAAGCAEVSVVVSVVIRVLYHWRSSAGSVTY